MLASETRQRAREALQGKWGKAVLATLIYALIIGIMNWLFDFIPYIGPIAVFLLTIPFGFGFTATLMKLKRGEDITYFEFITNGFNAFGKAWTTTLWTLVKMLLPIVAMIVSMIIMSVGLGLSFSGALLEDPSVTAATVSTSGSLLGIIGFLLYVVSWVWAITKSYLYKLSFFVLFDNPNMTGKEVVEETARLMNGNRWKLFCLELSFIGWAILAAFTFGIGFLWLMPYILFAQVVFYENLAGKLNVQKEENNLEEPKNDEIITEN